MPQTTTPPRHRLLLAQLGKPLIAGLAYTGALTWIAIDIVVVLYHALIQRKVRLGRKNLYSQLVRLGVRSIAVIMLVNACIGIILAIQMAPPLDEFGQTETIPNIVSVAVLRELGPLISAIVLTGFAGAAVAAELGSMVVGEEVEALETLALSPIRFLVVPRVLATVIALAVLCIIGEVIAIAGGWAIGVTVLDIQSQVYIDNTLQQVGLADFLTGLSKACFFGAVIGLVACHNGLAVTGGATGVGRATTNTVVHSIVAIIASDLIFTTLFFKLGWT